jgi:carbonic anhydrase
MKEPVSLSQAQHDFFARLYPMNARPVQATAGRIIKQSQ